MAYENDSREKFEDTEGVIRSRKSKTNRQYNDQENKDKQWSKNTTQNTNDRRTRTPLIFPPGKISIYSSFPLIFRGKSEYILKFPPHTQFSPFALIDYTRAITPIRGRPYGDFCRAFDAEEGRSPLFFSICNTFWNISQWLQFDPYVLFLAMAAMFFHRQIYNSQTIVYTPYESFIPSLVKLCSVVLKKNIKM